MYHCIWLHLFRGNESLCTCRYLRRPVKLLDSLKGVIKVANQWRGLHLWGLQPSWGYAGCDCAMWQRRHVWWVVSFSPPSPFCLSRVRPQLWVMLHASVTAASMHNLWADHRPLSSSLSFLSLLEALIHNYIHHIAFIHIRYINFLNKFINFHALICKYLWSS